MTDNGIRQLTNHTLGSEEDVQILLQGQQLEKVIVCIIARAVSAPPTRVPNSAGLQGHTDVHHNCCGR
jgi:hypothetical protein